MPYSINKNKPKNQNICQKVNFDKGLTKISIDWERLFHDSNLKIDGAIVIPRFSTSFGDIGR